MAKKTKKEFVLNKYYPYIVFAVALGCAGMMFLPGVDLVFNLIIKEEVTSVMGWQVIFGYTGTEANIELMTFSFMALLAVILPVAGGLVPLLLRSKLGAMISLGCFAVGAVFAFMMVLFVMPTTALTWLTGANCTIALGIGSILLGALSIVGAGFGAIKILVK